MTRHIAAVLTRLVGATGDHILDRFLRKRAAREERADHAGEQVIGTQRRERAGVPAEGGSQSVVQISVEH